MVITLTVKPRAGRFDRICKACGNSYNGWNFVLCQECESLKVHTVIAKW